MATFRSPCPVPETAAVQPEPAYQAGMCRWSQPANGSCLNRPVASWTASTRGWTGVTTPTLSRRLLPQRIAYNFPHSRLVRRARSALAGLCPMRGRPVFLSVPWALDDCARTPPGHQALIVEVAAACPEKNILISVVLCPTRPAIAIANTSWSSRS